MESATYEEERSPVWFAHLTRKYRSPFSPPSWLTVIDGVEHRHITLRTGYRATERDARLRLESWERLGYAVLSIETAQLRIPGLTQC